MCIGNLLLSCIQRQIYFLSVEGFNNKVIVFRSSTSSRRYSIKQPENVIPALFPNSDTVSPFTISFFNVSSRIPPKNIVYPCCFTATPSLKSLR